MINCIDYSYENSNIPSWLKLNLAKNAREINEWEYALGKKLSVVWLANCLGIWFINQDKKIWIAAHIWPFGWEKYDSRNIINEWTESYINFLILEFNWLEPTDIIIRTRNVGSRPLFHWSFIKILKEKFPKINIDIKNWTDLKIDFT